MKFLRSISFWMLLLLASFLVFSPATADAAKKGKVDNQAMIGQNKEAAKSPPWATPYIIVTLTVLLGAAVVCEPTRRQDEARPESGPITGAEDASKKK